MKSRLLGFFLMLGLLIVTPSIVLSIEVQDEPFEGQDDIGDFLIGEMDEQYPDDQKYLQGEEDHSMMEEEPKTSEEDEEDMDEDTQDEDTEDEEIFE